MGPTSPLSPEMREQVARFEDTVWHLRGHSPAPDRAFDHADCAALPGGFAAVLAAQTPETLALAVQIDFYRGPAFVELFVNRFRDQIVLWLVRRGHRHHEAEDAAGDVILRLWGDQLCGYDPKRADFRAYLWVVATSHGTSQQRKKRPDLIGERLERAGPDATQLDVLARDLQAALHRLLARLPDAERAVIQKDHEGLETKEIAEALGVTVAVVYRRRFSAGRKLRGWLADAALPSRAVGDGSDRRRPLTQHSPKDTP